MKILVGMSGGVDSSVVSCILKDEGYDVIGATMSIWDKSKHYKIELSKDACFSAHEEQDVQQAKKLCQKLAIPYYVIDCTKQYQKMVLDNFKEEYLSGRTPNPCVRCNSKIKFEALPRSAQEQGIVFDKFATGHYARLSYNEKTRRYQLAQALDEKKDQSYFLYRLTQEQLSKILFPLGEYTKEEVRAIAHKYKLEVSDKKDSQDFYTGDINDILEQTPKEGNFVNKQGKILGKHQGIWNFTIGQRRGLGISADRPLYVIDINKDRNEVVLGYAEDGLKIGVKLKEMAWLSVASLKEETAVKAKVRSSQAPIKAKIIPINENIAEIYFDVPQKAIATGQSVVLYDDEGYVLGGGIIEDTINATE